MHCDALRRYAIATHKTVRARNILRLQKNVIDIMQVSSFDHAICMLEREQGEKSDEQHTRVATAS
jgi:hypothetical protein